MPGAVKCYVRTTISGGASLDVDGNLVTPVAAGGKTITGKTVGSTEVVGIYENEDITPTMPAPRATGDGKGTLTPDDATLTAANGVDFIEATEAGVGEPDFQERKLCNLFKEIGEVVN